MYPNKPTKMYNKTLRAPAARVTLTESSRFTPGPCAEFEQQGKKSNAESTQTGKSPMPPACASPNENSIRGSSEMGTPFAATIELVAKAKIIITAKNSGAQQSHQRGNNQIRESSREHRHRQEQQRGKDGHQKARRQNRCRSPLCNQIRQRVAHHNQVQHHHSQSIEKSGQISNTWQPHFETENAPPSPQKRNARSDES